MNIFSNIVAFLFLALGLISCKVEDFDEKEIRLLKSGNIEVPMRVLSITDKDDSILLRKPSLDIKGTKGNKDLELLIKRLKTTMLSEDGIGIAAIQVGVRKNVFLFSRIDEAEEKIQVVINPRIVAHSDSLVCFQRDGCLSIPDIRGNSKRYAWIEVSYFDENGREQKEKFSGFERPKNFMNIIFQHEYDHTKGILFIDKLCD